MPILICSVQTIRMKILHTIKWSIMNNYCCRQVFIIGLFILPGSFCFAQNLHVGTGFYIAPGAVVYIQGGTGVSPTGNLQNMGEVTIEGNLTNHGIINEVTAGRYTLKSYNNALSIINGSNPVNFFDLVLDNIHNFNFSTPARVQNNLLFTNGYVNYTALTPFVFAGAATYSNLNATSHIAGIVGREGSSDFIFPVGTGTKLKRAAISNIIGGSSATFFTVDYKPVIPPNNTSLLAPLTSISNKEYWDINRNDPGNAVVQVEFTPADYLAAAGNESLLRLANFNGSQWQAEGLYDATLFPSVKSTTGVSFLPLFTIGGVNNVVLPLENILLRARKLDEITAEINWEVMGDLSDVESMDLQKADNAMAWKGLASLPTSKLKDNYKDNQLKAGMNYYRIKVWLLNNSVRYSNIVSVFSERNSLVSVFPTFAVSTITIKVEGDIRIQHFSIYDATGRKMAMNGNVTGNTNLVDVSSLNPGNYFLKLQTNKGIKTFPFIKR